MCSWIPVSQYLVKECLKVTGPQVQLGHLIWPCAVQITQALLVVVQGHVLVSNLKAIGQSQDVAVMEEQCGCYQHKPWITI